MVIIARIDWLTCVKEALVGLSLLQSEGVSYESPYNCLVQDVWLVDFLGQKSKQSWRERIQGWVFDNKWLGLLVLAWNEGFVYSHTLHSWCLSFSVGSCRSALLYDVHCLKHSVRIGNDANHCLDPGYTVLFSFQSHWTPKTSHITPRVLSQSFFLC